MEGPTISQGNNEEDEAREVDVEDEEATQEDAGDEHATREDDDDVQSLDINLEEESPLLYVDLGVMGLELDNDACNDLINDEM